MWNKVGGGGLLSTTIAHRGQVHSRVVKTLNENNYQTISLQFKVTSTIFIAFIVSVPISRKSPMAAIVHGSYEHENLNVVQLLVKANSALLGKDA